MSEPQQPLSGLLVLDLTRVLSGPYCTMILRDLGARVIKIEHPLRGDDSRQFPPFVEETQDSGYFLSINRGKESVALDFNHPQGKALLEEMIKKADVLVENFSPGLLERKGLEPDRLLELNPRLIIGRLSGYGQSGPEHQLPAYDIAVQARAGLMSITGPEGGPPVKVGSALSDIGGGLHMTIGILAALHERHRSGKGQVLDISMLDGTVALLENSIVRQSMTKETPRPVGQRHPSISPFDGFKCSDGIIVVGAANEEIFHRLVDVLGKPEWKEDPRFISISARNIHQKTLKVEIDAIMKHKTMDEWLVLFRQASVPASKIQTIDQVIADPQVQHRGLIERYQHPNGKAYDVVATAFKNFSRTPGASPKDPPQLGEHTDAVLKMWLGLNEDEIKTLRQAKAIR